MRLVKRIKVFIALCDCDKTLLFAEVLELCRIKIQKKTICSFVDFCFGKLSVKQFQDGEDVPSLFAGQMSPIVQLCTLQGSSS